MMETDLQVMWKELDEEYPYDPNIYRFIENGHTVHSIDISDSWYRNIGTLEGLRHRLTRRFSFWYKRGKSKEYHPNLRYFSGSDMMVFRKPSRHIEHRSVKDFYECIGYEKGNTSVKQLDRILSIGWKSNV